jgi:DNA-directed RNA polymerase subunit RPC12/RpoP
MEVEIGKWYLCAKCGTCEQALPLFEVLPNAPVSGDGSFSFREVLCPYCGAKHDYPLESLQRLQAQPGGLVH